MRLLVFGGSVFLSKAVVAEAVAGGHEVVAVCRGTSGPVPPGARVVGFDRADGDLAGLRKQVGHVDTVVDVGRRPSWVRAAVQAFPEAHWVFVSTVNVYADPAAAGDTAAAPLVEPIDTDQDLAATPEAYGPMKVACENAVRAGAASATVIRPGLIVGPADPSGRFAYWPRRLAAGGQVLAPPADDPVQVIDVRDLAAWIVTCAERRLVGDFDGIGPHRSRRKFLTEIAAGVGADPTYVWTDPETLAAHDVQPWTGDRSLPVWVPGPDAEFMARDVSASLAAGLAPRPLADTARDTLAWLRSHPEAKVTGLSRDDEAEAIRAGRGRPDPRSTGSASR